MNESLFSRLPALGWSRLDRLDERVFITRDGNRYPTFQRAGVRVAISSGRSLGVHRNTVLIYDACDPNELVIWAVLVDPAERRRGLATLALQEITRIADELGLTLYLEPTPLDPDAMGKNDLMRFYGAHGFQSTDEAASRVMQRMPAFATQ